MSLYLVQHGKCYAEDVDPDRSLTPDGIAEATGIANIALGYGVHISEIWHSGKKRALQTAEIFQSVTGSDRGVKVHPGMGPNDDVAAFTREFAGEDIMLVGHLPFMSRLASYLVTGDSGIPVFRFRNGGLLCLDRNTDTGRWIITCALMPAAGSAGN